MLHDNSFHNYCFNNHNFTEHSLNSTEYNHEALWISAQLLIVVNLLATIYISISLIIYGRRTGKLEQPRNSTIYQLIVVAIACPFCLIPKLAMAEFQMLVTENQKVVLQGSTMCQAALYIDCITDIVVISPKFIFLWLRKNSIYKIPIISDINTMTIKVLSIISWCTFAASILV